MCLNVKSDNFKYQENCSTVAARNVFVRFEVIFKLHRYLLRELL
jgi:hypothetical protein